jgi:hypothetical protein
MAETAGLVQKLTVLPGAQLACVWLGPAPSNSTLLFVERESSEAAAEGSFENSMVDAIAAAAVARREIVAYHDDNSSRITSLRIDPA